jgi:hypothetical protein
MAGGIRAFGLWRHIQKAPLREGAIRSRKRMAQGLLLYSALYHGACLTHIARYDSMASAKGIIRSILLIF